MIPGGRQDDLIERLKVNPFIDGPTEALVKSTASQIALVKEWRYIFRGSIDVYERTDYAVSQLPALRVTNTNFTKEHESHYINGELHTDIILPPELRRDELQSFQDTLSAALLQQFRRPPFFAALQELVPGINELGKVFAVDKSLGMAWQDGILPLTRITANFRIDLKQWDAYLEEQGRTKDDPFNVTLKNLVTIATGIIPYLDSGTPDTTAQAQLDVTIPGGS